MFRLVLVVFEEEKSALPKSGPTGPIWSLKNRKTYCYGPNCTQRRTQEPKT